MLYSGTTWIGSQSTAGQLVAAAPPASSSGACPSRRQHAHALVEQYALTGSCVLVLLRRRHRRSPAARAVCSIAPPPVTWFTPSPSRRRLQCSLQATEQCIPNKIRQAEHNEHACWLLEWPLPDSFKMVDAWLDDWTANILQTTAMNEDAKFWQRRVSMAIQQRLLVTGHPDFDDPRRVAKENASTIIYALHLDGELSAAPLALALIADRDFAVGGVRALHLDHLLAQPGLPEELRGAGAAIIQTLLQCASEAGQVLTVEPQSKFLEEYFGRLGFSSAPVVDPYVWFLAGPTAKQVHMELRYALLGSSDHERLIAAFKRPPSEISRSEEVFIRARQDNTACKILSVQVDGMELITRAQATATCFTRVGAGTTYTAEPSVPVDVTEAMAATRDPEALRYLGLESATCLSAPASSGPHYVVVGRCTIERRAYPLPGLSAAGAELVLDKLEIPTCNQPFFSMLVSAPMTIVGDASTEAKSLLDRFKVRSAVCRSSATWNLEIVQTDGLIAAALEPDPLLDDQHPVDF